MKLCSKCKIEKDLVVGFHRCAASRDGHQARCKDCYNAYTRAYYAEDIKASRESRRRHYAKDPAAYRESQRLRRAKAPKSSRESSRKRRVLHPEKIKAVHAVNNAIATGKLVRPSQCSIDNCEGSNIEAHHSSYAQEDWLKVTWLCAQHHHDLHRKLHAPELNP